MSGTTIYAYDLDNRLRTVNLNGAITTFGYSPDGLMNKMVPAGVVTNLLYDGDKLAAESNASSTVLKRYVHGPGIDEPLVAYEGSATANKSWLYADHQGSIIAQANGAGSSTATYSYGPFGEANTSSGVRFRYTGQQYIPALNLYYYKARFYSLALGRFLQTDPIGYQDDMNLYAYVGNDPLNRTDPTGMANAQVNKLLGKLYDDSNATRIMVTNQWDGFWSSNVGDELSRAMSAMAPEATVVTKAPKIAANILNKASNLFGVGEKATIRQGGKILSSQDIKSINSYEKRIYEHQQKLQEFKTNPTVRPGMENLSPEIIKAQQAARINHLETEIRIFQNNINKITGDKK